MIRLHADASSQSSLPEPPSHSEICSALERIANSAQFRASPQLVAFLRYVVEETLAGHSAKIKSYTIAVEALDRDSSFDPQTDAIVRVEAGRLRRALARYYASDGRDDPVVTDLPRGSYVPHFRHRASVSSSAPASTFQAAFERLVALHRQLETMAAEMESVEKILERADRWPGRPG